MQFRHIMKSLKDDYTISVCSEQNTDKINDIQLLDPLAESYDPQVLLRTNMLSLPVKAFRYI